MSARPRTAIPTLAGAMSETDLLGAVISLAEELGWMAFHPKPAQTRRGDWLTFAAGRSGYPDLTLARNGFVIFAELKSEKGRVSDAQAEWRLALTPAQRAPSHSYRVWRPTDWLDGTIERVLRRGW